MSYQIPTQFSSPFSSFPMSISGIQGQVLEVTVVGCNNLKGIEIFPRQDPYVCIEYATYKHRTRTSTNGGQNPTFQQKFVIPLNEGLMEMNVKVWNRNGFTFDNFVGEGKVQLHKVLSQGHDDRTWPIQTQAVTNGGAVRLIMHYSYEKPVPSAPALPEELMHLLNSPRVSDYPNHLSPYLSYSSAPSYPAAYPSNPAAGEYSSSSCSAPPSAAYAPGLYPPSTTYSKYPPPPQASSFCPPPKGPYGMYPRPPY